MELTQEFVRSLVPRRFYSNITEEFIDVLNNAAKDETIGNAFKENFLLYTDVLKGGKYSIRQYVDAVRFVSYKLLGYNILKAFSATFPERSAKALEKSQEQLYAVSAAYNGSKLVSQIYQQTLVPTYVLNAPLHQKALSVLGRMIEDPSIRGMAKVKACEAILQYTKQPDEIKGKIEVSVEGGGDTIAELREVTSRLAAMMQQGLQDGSKSLTEVNEEKIVDVSFNVKEKEALEEAKDIDPTSAQEPKKLTSTRRGRPKTKNS